MPTASISPLREMMLIVMLAPKMLRARYIRLKVKTMAMGMATMMMAVDRHFLRKNRRMRTAMIPPITPETARSRRLFKMSSDWSREKMTVMSRSAGSPSPIRPMVSRTARQTSTMLALDAR